MPSLPDDHASEDVSAVSGRLAAAVYEQIDRLIRRGEFPKGVKLPPESELARRFGVSRPVVREALARLRDEGIVRSQQGSGTFVIRGMLPSAAALPQIRTLADLLALLRVSDGRGGRDRGACGGASDRRRHRRHRQGARRCRGHAQPGPVPAAGRRQFRFPPRGGAGDAQSLLRSHAGDDAELHRPQPARSRRLGQRTAAKRISGASTRSTSRSTKRSRRAMRHARARRCAGTSWPRATSC